MFALRVARMHANFLNVLSKQGKWNSRANLIFNQSCFFGNITEVPVSIGMHSIQKENSGGPSIKSVRQLEKQPTFFRDVLKLTKLNLSTLNALAASMTFGMILPFDVINNLGIFIGTTILAGSSQAINQVIESRYDAMMSRTRNRPIPTGRFSSNSVMLGSVTGSLGGGVLLSRCVVLFSFSFI